jgi:hypothetical protein
MKFETRVIEDGSSSAYVLVPEGLSANDPIVIYVHGYGVTTSRALEEYRLAEQFAESGIRALYIVPEAPSGNGEGVAWPDLGQLLADVKAIMQGALPRGPVLVVGHSGAYRTLASWTNRNGHAVALLDGWYSGARQPFANWIKASSKNVLVLVGSSETGTDAKAFVAEMAPHYGDHLEFADPAAMAALETFAKLLTMGFAADQSTHMGLVTGGYWIPWTIRRLNEKARKARARAKLSWLAIGLGVTCAASVGVGAYAYSRRRAR